MSALYSEIAALGGFSPYVIRLSFTLCDSVWFRSTDTTLLSVAHLCIAYQIDTVLSFIVKCLCIYTLTYLVLILAGSFGVCLIN